MQYVAVIGDIIGSRAISDGERAAVQARLRDTLHALNARGDHHTLVSPYTVTLGDEFQAVFSQPSMLFLDAIEINAALFPVSMRFAFGLGAITTPINPRQALEMDGPAFHRARLGIDSLKKTGGLFALGGVPSPDAARAQHCLDLLSHQMTGWGASRLRVLWHLYHALRQCAGQSYGRGIITQIAQATALTPSAVYKSIEAGALNTVIAVLEDITELLANTLEGSA
jgi:hypothetical protein